MNRIEILAKLQEILMLQDEGSTVEEVALDILEKLEEAGIVYVQEELN